MDTITIRTYNPELGTFTYHEINLNEITQFGIKLTKMKYRNGNFRDFIKVGFVYFGKNSVFFRDIKHIATLKKELKGKYTTEKRPEEVYKPRPRGYVLKRGIHWTYRIKEQS